MTPLIISRVSVERILDLRHRELRQGLPPESARFDGDDSPETLHLAAEINGKVVGCATVLLNTFDNQPACQLRGMAVDRQHQRSGVGSQLLEEVHRIAAEKKVPNLWANARTPAVDFYRKHGWQTVGQEFQIPHAGPHFRMVQKINKLAYAPHRSKPVFSIFEILTLCSTIAFMVCAIFVHLDFRPDRQWPLWRICRDYGWIIGLTSLVPAGIGLFSPNKRIFNGIVVVLTIFSFIWWATWPIYR